MMDTNPPSPEPYLLQPPELASNQQPETSLAKNN
jgi:hypothetical protein